MLFSHDLNYSAGVAALLNWFNGNALEPASSEEGQRIILVLKVDNFLPGFMNQTEQFKQKTYFLCYFVPSFLFLSQKTLNGSTRDLFLQSEPSLDMT